MLSWTGCSLTLIDDPAMFKMLDPNLRGGFSMISARSARANNKYLVKLYMPSKATIFIMYLDANNLYGWSMSQAMPEGYFGLVHEDEWESMGEQEGGGTICLLCRTTVQHWMICRTIIPSHGSACRCLSLLVTRHSSNSRGLVSTRPWLRILNDKRAARTSIDRKIVGTLNRRLVYDFSAEDWAAPHRRIGFAIGICH